jgi:hypothetical protein
VLADELKKINLTKLQGEPLRKALLTETKRRLKDLNTEIQSATKYF